MMELRNEPKKRSLEIGEWLVLKSIMTLHGMIYDIYNLNGMIDGFGVQEVLSSRATSVPPSVPVLCVGDSELFDSIAAGASSSI